jgi:hypothetical protein
MNTFLNLPSPEPAPPVEKPASTRSNKRHCLLGCMGLIISSSVLLALLGWSTAAYLKQGLEWLTNSSSHVKHHFQQELQKALSTQGEVLEVATLEALETVSRVDQKKIFHQSVDLGTTLSEIRVRVLYRYHLRLSDPWQIRQLSGGGFEVTAPALKLSTPSAIRTETMEKHTAAGWLRFNAAENLTLLERELTQLLDQRGESASQQSSVREAARASAIAFVRTWLLKNRTDSAPIQLRFADEMQPPL